MVEHPCEYQEESDGAMCGAPASRRLTGEKVLCDPWTLLVCSDHRRIAAFVMELRGYNSRKEVPLLDAAEGQIANLEDWLLDAARCAIADLEPKDRDGMKWLDGLLYALDHGFNRYGEFYLGLAHDTNLRAAITQAAEFYEAQQPEETH